MIADHFAARRGLPRDGEVPYRRCPQQAVPRPRRLERDAVAAVARIQPFARPDADDSAGPRAFDPGSMAAAGRAIFAQGGMGSGAGSGGGPASTCSTSCAARRALDHEGAASSSRLDRGSRERIANLLREHHFKDAAQEDTWRRSAASPRARCRWSRWVERGFVAERIAWWASKPAGRAISRPPRRRKRADQFIAEATKSPRATWWCTRNTASAAIRLETLHVTGAPHDCRA